MEESFFSRTEALALVPHVHHLAGVVDFNARVVAFQPQEFRLDGRLVADEIKLA